ncbi:MAG: prefoldin subunit alpha [Candidatus Aenigmatarchaeota archaeon]
MDKDAQQKLMRFQVLESNLSMVRNKHEEALKRLGELEVTRRTIEELKEVKPSAALISIGSNNFVEGKMGNTDSIIVGIGSGVAVKKKREDALRIIDGHVKQLSNVIGELARDERKIVEELQKLQSELQKISKGK